MIRPAVAVLAQGTSTARACALLGKPRASHYREQRPPVVQAQRTPRPAPVNALSVAEQDAVIATLTSPRFCDKSVAQTWATLPDEGIYLASMSTMHRLLRLIGQGGDRRAQAAHPAKNKPELMATRPGQVWSWTSSATRRSEPSGHGRAPPPAGRSQPVVSEGSLIPGTGGECGSSPDNDGTGPYCQMAGSG